MRNLPLGATLTASLVGLLAGPAAAQQAPVVLEATPAPAPQAATAPRPAAPSQAATAPADAARLRQLQEELFARDRLTLRGRRLEQGGVAIKTAEFYSYMGRRDLVDQIGQRKVLKGLGIGVGAALLGVGAAWGVMESVSTSLSNASDNFSCTFTTDPSDCQPDRHASMLPWGVAVIGGMALAGGVAVPSDPLSGTQKRELVDDYNRRLRASMGLSSALEAASRTAKVRAAVQPDGRSGMLLASCAF